LIWPASSPAGPQHETPHDLEGLLRPLSTDAFLANDYGRRSVYSPGTPGKFTALFPWSVLNEVLEQHRLEPPRLRLTREGKPAAPSSYLSYQPNRRTSGSPIPRLNASGLAGELRSGATLVLDNVDELHRPVRRIAEALERIFRVRVQVNLYAGWRTSHGFDLHWDDHDVFIVQVAGRKHWQIYGVTRPYPLARDAARAEPPSTPIWERVLEDGDLLYIPRGWWHVATPLDEPTLHLTVGVNNPTGADLLAWFGDRLRASEVIRQDIPHLEGVGAMRAYAGRVMGEIARNWRPELVDEYMAYLDAKSAPRPHCSLPWSATGSVLPTQDWRVQWTGSRALPIETSGDEIAISTQGRRYRFAPAARPLLETLLSGREYAREDLESAASLPNSTVEEFVRELAANGLVVVR
jgi:hypothetical protein